MKHFVAIILIFSTFQSQAQITIDNNDMPIPGYWARLSAADTVFQPDLQTVGANVSWDFTGMNAITQRQDTFGSVNNLPPLIRILFLSANVVRIQETPDSLGGIALSEGYQFFRTTNSRFVNKGLGGTINGIPFGLSNNPDDIIYRFPLNYQDVDSSESLAQLNIPGIFYIERSVKRWNEVDAWGQLDTPYGSFNSLRVKTTIQESDSIAADTISFRFNVPTRREYKWLAKEERIPVMTVNTILVGGNEIPAGIQYVDSLRNTGGSTSVDEDLTSVARMYPNPASDFVNLEVLEQLGADARIEVYNQNGQKLMDQKLIVGINQLMLGNMPNGLYHVRIISRKKNYTGTLLRQ
ncbi:MAG: T9SS type A sorting domain-containing protein [Bacteroidota bacterium]